MPSASTVLDSPAGVLTAELRGLVDEFLHGVSERVRLLAECGTNRELIDVVQSIERAARAAEQATASVVSSVESRGLHQIDGHRDAKSWLRAGVHLAPHEVNRRHRIGRFTRAFPQVAEALAAGEVSASHVNRLALVGANPRIRHQFESMVDVWLVIAASKPYEQFCSLLGEWERQEDADGGHRDRDASHRARDFRLLTVGETTLLRGQLGAVQAEVLQQIFQAFVDAEWRYDVDQAKALYGVDHVVEQMLPRTPAQRRGDALLKIFEAAAIAPLGGVPIKVTVDIVIDQETFEDQLLAIVDPLYQRRDHATVPWPTDDPHGSAGPSVGEHLAGLHLALISDDAGGSAGGDGELSDVEPATDAERWIASAIAAAENDAERAARVASMCRTRRGSPLTATDAVAAAVIGHVRRVVVGARGVIIDVGAKGQLFTGSARQAALLQAAIDGHTRCIWPGCTGAPRHVDHTIPRCEGGATAPDNSGLMCARHNIFKTCGYRTRRDGTGMFHLYRPDGSELIAI